MHDLRVVLYVLVERCFFGQPAALGMTLLAYRAPVRVGREAHDQRLGRLDARNIDVGHEMRS